MSGHFHFTSKVTLEEITTVAQEFAQDDKFLKLFIQGAGDQEFRLCFIYDPKINEEKVPFTFVNEFLDNMTDLLRKKFGNGLKGWSGSNRYTLIK